MNGERAREVHALFEDVVDREPAAREALLRERSTETRDAVGELMAAHEAMGDFLSSSAAERLARDTLEPGTRVGSYLVIRVLGAGGGGVVYEAEQLSPQRRVALKVRQGGLGSSASLRRFREEAEILARLQHPDIAHVYEAGVHEGLPYFALEFVPGARHLVQYGRELPLRERLALFARVCNAIHHGHQKGIIHRDLKPSNILVLPGGDPKIIDFGIARVEGVGLAHGELVGTPPYMSPEQCIAGNEDIDVRSDVYALGVVLYQLVAGALPHDVGGVAITEATRRIRNDPPAPLPRRLPRDLSAIVLKALGKEREKRYASAAALGDDVAHFLAHEPVEARRAGRLHEMRLFARRHPALVAALAVVALVLAGATAVSLDFAHEATRARDRERMQAYAANVAAANSALRIHNVAEARRRLAGAPAELRNWEWHYLAGQLDGSEATLHDPSWLTFFAAPVPGTGTIVELGHERAGDGDAVAALWDARSGRMLGKAIVPGPPACAPVFGDGWMAWGTDEGVLVADPGTLEILRRLDGPAGMVHGVGLGPAMLLCTDDGALHAFDTETWTLRRSFGNPKKRYHQVAVSADGSVAAAAENTRLVELWDPRNGEALGILEGHEARVEWLWFTNDGRLFTASADATLRVWDPGTRRELDVLRGPPVAIFSACPSPSGDRVLTSHEDGAIRVWDVAKGRVRTTLQGHEERSRSVGFLPDGRGFSTGTDDGLKLWNLAPPAPTLGTFEKAVVAVAFSPDGRRLAAGSWDGTVRVHEEGAKERILDHGQAVTAGVAFSPDGRRLVVGAARHVALWDTATWDRVRSLDDVRPVCVAVGAKYVATADVQSVLTWWDASTGEPRGTHPLAAVVSSLVFLPGGDRLVAASPKGITLWDLGRGARVEEMRFPEGGPALMALGPDGRTVAVACHAPWDAAWRARPSTIYIVDVPTWKLRRSMPGPASALALSPDGTRLAAGGAPTGEGSPGVVRLFDLESAQLVLELYQTTWVQAIAFSPDGRRLATASGSYSNHGCELRLATVPGK